MIEGDSASSQFTRNDEKKIRSMLLSEGEGRRENILGQVWTNRPSAAKSLWSRTAVLWLLNENKENLKRQCTVEDTTDQSVHRYSQETWYSMTKANLNATSHRYFHLNASKKGACFVLSSHCGTSNLCHVSGSRENSKEGQLNELFHICGEHWYSN